MRQMKTDKDFYVRALKAAAFEIIENAEKLIGDVDHTCDVTVTIKLSPDEAVITEVSQQHVSMVATDAFFGEDRE